MPGINAGSPLDDMRGLGVLSLKNIADAAGVSSNYARELKSGRKALGPGTARSVAAASGGTEKAANLYLVTQAAALKSKIERGSITPQGVRQSLGRIVENIQGGFHRDEYDRSDVAFKDAQEELQVIAESVFDILGDDEPEVATKSAGTETGIQRDLYGRRMQGDGAGVDRDFYGRRMD